MKQRNVVAGVFFGIWLFLISVALVALIAFAVVQLRGNEPAKSAFEPTRATCQMYASPSFVPANETERDHFGQCEAAGAFH
jgi:hypothetical protein